VLPNVPRHPDESFAVAHPTGDAAHEDLHGPYAGRAGEVDVALARRGAAADQQAEAAAQVVLRCGVREVDLVPEHEEGDAGQRVVRQQRVQLRLGLGEPGAVGGVHHVDHRVDLHVPPT
jgi:hypothetical protein